MLKNMATFQNNRINSHHAVSTWFPTLLRTNMITNRMKTHAWLETLGDHMFELSRMA
jgi:hypothetical protein